MIQCQTLNWILCLTKLYCLLSISTFAHVFELYLLSRYRCHLKFTLREARAVVVCFSSSSWLDTFLSAWCVKVEVFFGVYYLLLLANGMQDFTFKQSERVSAAKDEDCKSLRRPSYLANWPFPGCTAVCRRDSGGKVLNSNYGSVRNWRHQGSKPVFVEHWKQFQTSKTIKSENNFSTPPGHNWCDS